MTHSMIVAFKDLPIGYEWAETYHDTMTNLFAGESKMIYRKVGFTMAKVLYDSAGLETGHVVEFNPDNPIVHVVNNLA